MLTPLHVKHIRYFFFLTRKSWANTFASSLYITWKQCFKAYFTTFFLPPHLNSLHFTQEWTTNWTLQFVHLKTCWSKTWSTFKKMQTSTHRSPNTQVETNCQQQAKPNWMLLVGFLSTKVKQRISADRVYSHCRSTGGGFSNKLPVQKCF